MGNLASLSSGLGFLGAAVGAGLVVIGTGIGIGRLAASALDGTARQPDATGELRTNMIIPAALIEGIALFALVLCLLVANNAVNGHKLELEQLGRQAAVHTAAQHTAPVPAPTPAAEAHDLAPH